MDNYRIYWPDLDAYSIIQSDILDWVIQHGINCGMPFIIEGDLPRPYSILFDGDANKLCIGRIPL